MNKILKCYYLIAVKVVQTFVCLQMKALSMTIQMKFIEQYFPMTLFIKLYKVVLTFESVDKTIKCDFLNESYLVVLSWYSLLCCTRWF